MTTESAAQPALDARAVTGDGTGAIAVISAAGVEAASGWWAEGHGSNSTALLLVSTVEENLEMFGTLFILVVLAYFARLGRSVALRAER